jgi:hypothetical protein
MPGNGYGGNGPVRYAIFPADCRAAKLAGLFLHKTGIFEK